MEVLKNIKPESIILLLDGNKGFSNIIQLSDNIEYHEDEGYLYCYNVIMGRTGIQYYKGSELQQFVDDALEPNKLYAVYRLAEDVFHEETIKSGIGKSFTESHPQGAVTTDNYQLLEVGTILKLWEDGDNLVGNLVIKDKNTIKLIYDEGVREVSLGYKADIVKDVDGKYYQKRIKINHLALVEKGRAGNARILDHEPKGDDEIVAIKEKKGVMEFLKSLSFKKKDNGKYQLVDSADKVVADDLLLEDGVYTTVDEHVSKSIIKFDNVTGAETVKRSTVANEKRTYDENETIPNAPNTNIGDETPTVTNDETTTETLEVNENDNTKGKGDEIMKLTFKDAMAELQELNFLPNSEFKDKALADLDKRAVEAGLGSIVPKVVEETIGDTAGTATNVIDVNKKKEIPKPKKYNYEADINALQDFADSFAPEKFGFDMKKYRSYCRNYREKDVKQILRGGRQ